MLRSNIFLHSTSSIRRVCLGCTLAILLIIGLSILYWFRESPFDHIAKVAKTINAHPIVHKTGVSTAIIQTLPSRFVWNNDGIPKVNRIRIESSVLYLGTNYDSYFVVHGGLPELISEWPSGILNDWTNNYSQIPFSYRHWRLPCLDTIFDPIIEADDLSFDLLEINKVDVVLASYGGYDNRTYLYEINKQFYLVMHSKSINTSNISRLNITTAFSRYTQKRDSSSGEASQYPAYVSNIFIINNKYCLYNWPRDILMIIQDDKCYVYALESLLQIFDGKNCKSKYSIIESAVCSDGYNIYLLAYNTLDINNLYCFTINIDNINNIANIAMVGVVKCSYNTINSNPVKIDIFDKQLIMQYVENERITLAVYSINTAD